MYSNHTADNLFLINALDDISRLQIHHNGITRILDTVVLSLNLAERALQSVPLRLVLLTALSNSDGVFEGGIVAPECKLLQRRAAGKEIEDRADNGLLLRGKRYTGGGLNVCVLDLERGLIRNTWYSFSFACLVMAYTNNSTVELTGRHLGYCCESGEL
jgi:hypothetical protein